MYLVGRDTKERLCKEQHIFWLLDSMLRMEALLIQAFRIALVTAVGRICLTPHLSYYCSSFVQVQFEAKCSMEILDDRMVDGFQALLMTSKPMLRTFDHVFQ